MQVGGVFTISCLPLELVAAQASGYEVNRVNPIGFARLDLVQLDLPNRISLIDELSDSSKFKKLGKEGAKRVYQRAVKINQKFIQV